MTNMNVYTEASATQQILFIESRSYRRVSANFYLPSIIAPPLNDHFVFVFGVWY